MTTYTKTTDFAAKDALTTGNPAKLVKGTEIDTEFANIALADATSLKNGGALGTPSSGTLTNCSGLPIAGLTSSTSTAIGVGSIELGHVSDTTITRSSAGVIAVEGVTVPLNGTGQTATFGTIELGHASDTTITRSSAGVIAVEGVTVPLNGTGQTATFGTIELGHASDTSITRVSAGKIAVEGVNVGTEGIIQNSQSDNYTLVLTDAGKHIYETGSGKTITIPANSSVAFPIGTAVTFISASNAVTIAITSDTMTLASVGTTGSRTLAANSIATAVKITSTSWIISGNGLT